LEDHVYFRHGFFTDAYDLFIIGVVMAILKPRWQVGRFEEGLVESTALLASAIGALAFGRAATGKIGGFVGVFLFPFLMHWNGLKAAESAATLVSALGLAVTLALLPETKN
jgi:hypothetical protein